MAEQGAGRPAAPRAGGRGRVTLSQVAQEAGVSLATASRAINGSSERRVREDLRERVLDAAQRLDYSPDANAQAMARGRTDTVGLIVQDIADPYFSAIAAGVINAADEAGCVVTLATTHRDPVRELEFIATLQNQRARAIIIAGGRVEDAAVNERLRDVLATYQDRGGRVALVGQPLPGLSTVVPDNAHGSADLARALHGLGYRDVGILAGPDWHTTARDRQAAFRDALAELGVEVPADRVVPGDFTRDGGHAAMTTLLRGEGTPRLVFAVNDVMAVGAMSAVREAGLDVPGDVAVAGFDDITTLRDVAPGLTTVALPMVEMGRLAVPLALDPADGPREVPVGASVVLRESTPRID
ncbi:LacI family DNA-binding transcriptional regulator [Georgenia sp. Z1344]|uniref:LacI family DNA-binding transcriptional regulator n=1 Tax=Georgenia sp. Z1344 TaxID=3416706 RepID=UPI003CF8CCCC